MINFKQPRMLSLVRLAAPMLACALVVTLPAQDNDPDRAVKGGGFPAGWSVRPDRGAANQINFTQAGDSMHFVMGPAGTFYNSSWTKSGNYSYSARVAQAKAPSHPTSYGIMFGGTDVGGAMPVYTYFLVRNQGDYYIANWEGARPSAVQPWTQHASVAKQGPDGKQANTLGVQVQGDNVIFSINGTEVTRLPKSRVHADGLVGFRIGHNMDIDIDQVKR